MMEYLMFLSNDAETQAMVEELIGRANAAMVNFLNIGARSIHHRAQVEVPKSEHHQPRRGRPNYPPESLEERSFVEPATPESHSSYVVYPGPYAASQEAGHMTYRDKGKEVAWVARDYTVEGTKSHYLEDAGKAVLPGLVEELALQGHIAIGDLPGFITTPQEMRVAGHREDALLAPTGEAQQIMTHEQSVAADISPGSLSEVPGGHLPPSE